MRKVIVVTGTPATGKTTVSKQLASKMGWKYIDVNVVIKENSLCEDYDKARHCNVVDIEKLNTTLVKLVDDSEESLIIDSHMAHFLPKEKVDLVVVTKCSLKELERRLRERGYPEAKVRENLDSEIFDICLIEAKEQGHNVVEVDTEEKINIEKIKKAILA